jgi:hypothetical protein
LSIRPGIKETIVKPNLRCCFASKIASAIESAIALESERESESAIEREIASERAR